MQGGGGQKKISTFLATRSSPAPGEDIRPMRLDLAGRQKGAGAAESLGAAEPSGSAEPASPKPVRRAVCCRRPAGRRVRPPVRAGAYRAGLGPQLSAGRPQAGLAGREPAGAGLGPGGEGSLRHPAPPRTASARVCGPGARILPSVSRGRRGPGRRFGRAGAEGGLGGEAGLAGAGLEGQAGASAVLPPAEIWRLGGRRLRF